ncbi:MAG TPA: leucine-rich repeat domain-containing protein [Bryobacteraceae bacterium]
MAIAGSDCIGFRVPTLNGDVPGGGIFAVFRGKALSPRQFVPTPPGDECHTLTKPGYSPGEDELSELLRSISPRSALASKMRMKWLNLEIRTLPFPFPLKRIAMLLALAILFVIPRPCLGQKNDSASENAFLRIANDPAASVAQKKTIAEVIRSTNAKNADDAYKKVMATDVLIFYGSDLYAISDLTPLAGFTHLKTLVLWNNQVTDLTPISTLTNLQTLRLELNRIADISPLRNLRNLQSLQLDDNQISDISPLAGLVNLRTLWISRNKVRNIAPLTGLVALQNLYLSGNPVQDLAPLNHLSVSDLRLSDIGIEDISALRDLNQNITALINIDLSRNRIRDVKAVSRLNHVSNLDLSENRITDISAFAHSKFAYLDLHGNQIADISAIESLAPNSVNLRNNPIKDYQPLLALFRAHPNVEIRADRGFEEALSKSVPVQAELAKSPVMGRWRSDIIDSENLVL